MKPRVIGFVIASAALALLPAAAAAQCEGGTSTAGYFTRGGSYVPGGCSYTSTTTPGQLYPSGAQPLPSTSPAQGLSALPGQPVSTGLLPVTSGDLGQPLGAAGAQPQTLGPGAANVLPGQVTPSMVGPVNTANVGSALGVEGVSNGLTTTVNNGAALGVTTPNVSGFGGTDGLVSPVTSTRGLPNTTGALSGQGNIPTIILPPDVGAPGTGATVNPGVGVAVISGTVAPFELATGTSVGVGSTTRIMSGDGQVLVAPQSLTRPGTTAYGFSLPAAPAVSAEEVSRTAPEGHPVPLAPGRGGPTFIGEERGSPDQVILSP